MDGLPRSPLHIVALLVLGSMLVAGAALAPLEARADDGAAASADAGKKKTKQRKAPPNVDADADAWLAAHLDAAMPFLLQSPLGPIDRAHISVVEELGNWGAARAKGGHQGTDFVLDLPHKAGSDRVLVGNIIAGRVVHLERGWGSYGNTVFVHRENAPQMVVIYAHLAEIDVAIGDAVEVGDVLGTFGCTGNCTGLSGHHVRNQVHVELYAMPESFVATDINWSELPMRQLRATATRTGGKTDGVDIAHYFDSFALTPVSRAEHAERYAKNKDAGGLATYLASADVETIMAHAASVPAQHGLLGDDHHAHVHEPAEALYYYGDDQPPAEDLLARTGGDDDVTTAAATLQAQLSALELGRSLTERLSSAVAQRASTALGDGDASPTPAP